MADIKQMITQIYLCKLESLLRISELGEEYFPVVFRIPMRAEGTIWTQPEEGSIFLLLFQLPRSKRDSCPIFIEGTNYPLK